VLGSLVLGWSPNVDVVVAIPRWCWRRARSGRWVLLNGRQLRAEFALAVANAGFILLMFVSGMVIPSRSCRALCAR
jgi:hypothetical protein